MDARIKNTKFVNESSLYKRIASDWQSDGTKTALTKKDYFESQAVFFGLFRIVGTKNYLKEGSNELDFQSHPLSQVCIIWLETC